MSSESTAEKRSGKIRLLTPIKVSQRALSTNFYLDCLPRNRQHSCRFFFSPTIVYFRLFFEQQSSDLIEITTMHLPRAEPNLLESQRDYRSHILIPDFRERMFRSVSRVARNVGLLVSGLLLLDKHVTRLGIHYNEATSASVALDKATARDLGQVLRGRSENTLWSIWHLEV